MGPEHPIVQLVNVLSILMDLISLYSWDNNKKKKKKEETKKLVWQLKSSFNLLSGEILQIFIFSSNFIEQHI